MAIMAYALYNGSLDYWWIKFLVGVVWKKKKTMRNSIKEETVVKKNKFIRYLC